MTKNGPYKFREFKLLQNLKFHEKLVAYMFRFFGYSVGSLTSLPMIVMNGGFMTSSGYSQQSSIYEENNQTVYRRIEAKAELFVEFLGKKTITDLFMDVLQSGKARRLLGYRDVTKEHHVVDQSGSKTLLELSSYNWLSCDEVYQRVMAAYDYFKSLNINQDRRFAIFAETSQDWLILAMALILLKAVIVTVFTTLTDENIIHAFSKTEPVAVLVDSKTSLRLINMVDKLPFIETIVYSSRVDKNQIKMGGSLHLENIKNIHVNEIYDQKIDLEQTVKNLSPADPEDLIFIMYTSGTTGTPKGVEIRQRSIVAAIAGSKTLTKYYSKQNIIAYLPLAHVLELMVEFAMIVYGGTIGYGSPGTLFPNGPFLHPNSVNDLAELQPSIMACVPMILERIHKTVMQKLKALPRIKQLLIQESYNLKAHFHSRGFKTPILNKLFFSKFSAVFGGNLKLCIVGGAYLCPDLEEFFNIFFFPFKQAYGSTEIACAGMMSNIWYNRPFNIGPPIGCSEIKLIPSIDDGSSSESSKNGCRGEIIVSGPAVSTGYFNDPAKTKEAFVTDPATGKLWYHTSDIGEYLPDGTFRIVGRNTDVIKLSHGEFVELNKVETAISLSKFADYCCAFPNSEKNALVAVVCLNSIYVLELGAKLNHEGAGFEELAQMDDVKQEIMSDIKTSISKAKLTKFENPKDIILTPDVWTIESGLLTSTLKIKRLKIAAKYCPS